MLAAALLVASSSLALAPAAPPAPPAPPVPAAPAAPAAPATSAASATTFDDVVERALSLRLQSQLQSQLQLQLQVPAHEPADKREVPLSKPGESGDNDANDTRPAKKSDASIDAPMTAAGSASTPQGRTLGIGLQLGYPTSLTIKYMVQADQGLVGGIGGLSPFSYSDPAFSLHVDYVYHPTILTSGEAFVVTWYIGGGGQIIVNNNPSQRAFFPDLPYYRSPTQLWLAARLPVGVSLAMTQLPIEIYLEANPSVLVFPALGFGIGASIGARFFL